MPNFAIPTSGVPLVGPNGLMTLQWYTFFNLLYREVTMPIITTVLVEGKDAENAQTTQYTAKVKIMIDKFTGYNHTAGAVTLAVNIVESGGTAANTNRVVLYTLAAGETYTFPEVVGHYLNAGDFISTIAGAANSVSIRASGREVT